jgi:hypothetical protein
VGGLLVAGSDAASLGIVGAFMGGALAAGASLGRFGMARIFEAAGRFQRSSAATRRAA